MKDLKKKYAISITKLTQTKFETDMLIDILTDFEKELLKKEERETLSIILIPTMILVLTTIIVLGLNYLFESGRCILGGIIFVVYLLIWIGVFVEINRANCYQSK